MKKKNGEPQSSHVSSTVTQVKLVRGHWEKSGVELKNSVSLAPRKKDPIVIIKFTFKKMTKIEINSPGEPSTLELKKLVIFTHSIITKKLCLTGRTSLSRGW